MSGLIYHNDERRILPKIERGKSYNEKRVLRNVTPKKNKEELIIKFKDDTLSDKISIWEKDKSLELAGEILSLSIVKNDTTNIKEVKDYLIKNSTEKKVLDWIFNEVNDEKDLNTQIADNKKKLINEPKDAVTWTEQAINYFEKGNVDKSKKCLESALTINNDFGFVLRNAARLYSHFGDNGRAINILKKSEYYKFDPQIISAELAFSQIEKRKTRGYDIGRKLLSDNQYTHFQLSELAGAIGTSEYFDGNYKQSEKLFDDSLIDPSENSLAQSLWYKKEPINKNLFELYNKSNEIQTHRKTKNNEFDDSLVYAKKWLNEEKFSIRPYKTASHLSGVILGDYNDAFDIIQKGMITQKIIKGDRLSKEEEFGLINDLAYYSLKDNDINKAYNYIKPMLGVITKTNNLKNIEYINLATIGLFLFRTGDAEMGRKLYRKSITHFKNVESVYSLGSAFINYFNEEILVLDKLEPLEKLKKELDTIINEESENDLIYLKDKALKDYKTKIEKIRNS